MKQLLPFKTAFVPVRPFFVLKEKPETFYDRFPESGDGQEFILNSLLKAAGLNATIYEQDSSGECLWANKTTTVCTGIMKMLMEGTVDASLVPTPLNAYKTGDLVSKLKFGVFDSDYKRVFLSTPVVEAKNASVNPYDISRSINWTIIILEIVLLLAVMAIINYKLYLRDKRITLLDTLMLHTFRIHRHFKLVRRKIMFFFIILHCFNCYNIISSNISSDLVVTFPAKYLKTLEDVLASNRTPAMMGGFGLIEEFQQSFGRDRMVKKLLLKRIRKEDTLFDTNKMMDAFLRLTMGVAYQGLITIFDMNSAANGIRNALCGLHDGKPEEIPKLKISDPFATVVVGKYYSHDIDTLVAERLSITDHKLQQSGLFERMETLVNPGNHFCVSMMERKEERNKNDIHLPFFIFYPFFQFFILALYFSILIFVFEISSHILVNYITRKSTQQQNSWSLRCLRLLCNVITPK